MTDEEYFKSDEFKDFWKREILSSWDEGLRGENYTSPRKEVFAMIETADEAQELMDQFEALYGRKLKMRQDGLFYFSYLETVL